MFALKPNLYNSATKIAFAVTIIVVFSACSQNRIKIDEENRIIPVSEFGPGESWRDEYEPPTKENFRKRVKSARKTSKSVVAGGH